MSRSLTSESVEILQGQSTPQYGSDNPNLYLYVYVNTDEQANKVRQRIIDSLDVLSQHCRWSGFMNIKTLKLVKFHDN